MRLSEAMMLGSATCSMEPGNWNSCALGAAANAVGIPPAPTRWRFGKRRLRPGRRIESIMERWPWLNSTLEREKLEPVSADPSVEDAEDYITFCFDELVCDGQMSIEQLIDWVRSVEPTCGTCNSFFCECESAVKAQERVEAMSCQ